MRYIILFFMSFILFLPQQSWAVKIRNLDSEKREFTINNGGEEQVISLEPGEFYQSIGPSITLKNKENSLIRTRPREEYMIKNGEIILQRRHHNKLE